MSSGSVTFEGQTELAFLAGGGEMGHRIRDLDWTRNPLGAPFSWPAPLRMALRIILTTQHPMVVFWGPELRCFYNDAFAHSLDADKHPCMLGAPLPDFWPETWDVIGPEIEQVMNGGGSCWHENQHLPVMRHRRLDDAYWTYSLSPLDDPAAPHGIGGILVVSAETTEHVLSDHRHAFLVDLDDALRLLSSPREVIGASIQALGCYLQVSRVGYGEVEDDTTIRLETCYTDGVAPLVGRFPLDSFGADNIACQRAGTTVVWHDVTTSSGHDLAMYESIDVRAFVSVPLVRRGSFRASLFVNHEEARFWADGDVRLIEQVATRIWDSVERLRVESQLALTTRRFELAIQHSPITVCTQDLELRYTWICNATQHRDPSEVLGRTDEELLERPEDGALLKALKLDVIRSGVMQRREVVLYVNGVERYYDLSIDPVLNDRGQVAGITCAAVDITEHKRAEEMPKLLVKELNHRVKNTLSLVQVIARQTLKRRGVTAAALSALDERLVALGYAHDLLMRTEWEKLALIDIARVALRFAGAAADRVRLSGAAVLVSPEQVGPIVMALHELCTNALKYGALSNETGVVRLTWSMMAAGPMVRMVWQEQGGPPVAPPKRRGFGSLMIESVLAQQLQGHARIQLDPGGLKCEIGFHLLPQEIGQRV